MKGKGIIIFLAGTSIGALVSYAFTKSSMERKQQEEFDNALNSMKENIENRIREELKDEAKQEEIDEKLVITEDDIKKNERVISENEYLKGKMLEDFKAQNKVTSEKPQHDKYSRKHIDYDSKDDLYSDEEEVPGPIEERSEPYSISYDDFAHENPHFTKSTLIYFKEDDTLIYDESEESIYDDESVLGSDWRDHIGEYAEDTVYIRNEGNNTDYEVIVRDASFEDINNEG